MKTPPELDRITDVVLAYRPKPKSKRAIQRSRRLKRLNFNQSAGKAAEKQV